MDSPGSSKPRKGLRKLMDKLSVSRSRSRSRSPSQSSQADPKTLAPSVGLAGNNEPTPNVVNPPTGLIDFKMNVPTVVEPSAEPEGAVSSQQNLANEGELLNTSQPPETVKAYIPSGADKPTKSAAWNALRTSLGLLHESTGVFPALSSAVGVLLSCVDGFETLAKHREDYGELATTLCIMSDSLRQHTSSMVPSGSTTYIAFSIERQVTEIQAKLGQMTAGGFRGASTGEEELLTHYRQVQSLFQQLQVNAVLSTWNIVNEQLAETRLEGLRPVRQATYDSSLSTEVSRRGCTEGTRTTVLVGLEAWLQDSSSVSIYWMNGMAGTGKTTIAYSFCEQVEKRKQLAANFFCTRNASDCRDTSRIVPTIAYQLARYSVPYRSALCDVLAQNPDIGSKHILKQFEQLLKDPLQQVKAAIPDGLVVVIDALDECQSRNGIERTLEMLLRCAEQVPLKFLITSRPEPEIYSRMQLHEQARVAIHLHDLEASLVQADIELYLHDELASISPTRTEVEQLAHRSGCLFIYAATLVRYIVFGKRVANPRQRLQSVLSLSVQSAKKHAEIDALYAAVLESALQEAQMEEHEVEDVKTVLRTVLFAQEPIDVETIAVLGGLGDPDRVVYALQPLRSVIHQQETTGLVSTLHASFPDFLLSSQRSGVFFCDAVQYSQLLAQRCFGVMKSQLRFNICALESSFVPDEQVGDLDRRIKSNISPTLAYVCQYWANHLGMATKSGVLLRMLVEFLSHRLLFWMEVLNLTNAINTGVDMLQKANLWINQIGSPVSGELSIRLVEDSYTFILGFFSSAASRSTPHLYISFLPFCSRSSLVSKHYWMRTQGLLELKGSLMDRRSSAALASWDDSKFTLGAFSSDGSRCVGVLDGALMIRNTYNGATIVGPITDHTEVICACSFSADDSKVVSASKDGVIRVWDAYHGTLISSSFEYNTSQITCLKPGVLGDHPFVPAPFRHQKNHIRSIVWSPDNTHIVACFWSSSTIHLWDVNTGRLLFPLHGHTNSVTMVAISPNGALIASASTDATVRLWKTQDGSPAAHPYTGHAPHHVRFVAFTPDGTQVVSCANGAQVWHIPHGSPQTVIEFGLNHQFTCVVASPNGKQFATGSIQGTISLWNAEDGTHLAGPFNESNYLADTSGFGSSVYNPIKQLMYTPEGRHLLARSSDGRITVWPLQDILSSSYSPILYPTTSIGSMVFSPDGMHILTRHDYPEAIRKWNVYDGSSIKVPNDSYPFHETHTTSLLSPDGLYLVTVEEYKTWQVIKTSDKSIVIGPWPNNRYYVASQFSQDSTTLAIAFSDCTTKLWDLRSQEVIAGPFPGHASEPDCVALSPDNELIASYTSDGILQVFNTWAPILNIMSTPSLKLGLPPNSTPADVYNGWRVQEDGWVMNSSSQLIFCLPPEFQQAWPSAHSSLIITAYGMVQVPKQTLFLGKLWLRCYSTDR